jgi:hypothetical protein
MRIETDTGDTLLDKSQTIDLSRTIDSVYEYLLSYYSSLQKINKINDNIYLPSIWYLGYGIKNNIQYEREYLYAINIDFNKHTQYYTQLQTRSYDAFVTKGADHVIWKPSRFDDDRNMFFITNCF